MQLLRIPAFADNWIHLAIHGSQAFVVDPGAAAPVSAVLARAGARLAAILLTHRHNDHTGGVAELRRATGCAVIGPAECAACGVDRVVAGGETVELFGRVVSVLAVPGHTAGHVAYHASDPGVVWTGDTLFAGGCGRALEGDAATLWRSLLDLRALPPETRVCDGHDYLADSLEFAFSLLPEDTAIRARLSAVQATGGQESETTIARERATNIFLRSDDPAVAAAVSLPGAPPATVFAELRRRKDQW